MATATEKHEGPLAVPVWREDEERVSKSERYLAKRLKAAAADHRSVAWSTFLVGSGIGLLGWLFVGVIAEHWLVPGGLPAWARAGWLVAAIAGLMAAAGKWLLPLLRYRINLVYAARTIEQGHPDLHNDLVNTVLLQGHSEGIPETVTHSLRRRTARGLARQPGDLVADRSQLLMMVYVLAALVVFACLYQIVSPKNLFVSAARLAAPWSRIMPPTRVQIAPPEFAWRVPPREGRGDDVMRRPLTVQRGEVTLHRGRQLIVSATIRGRRRGEQPQVTVVPLGENGRPDIASSWTVDMVRRGAGVDGDEVADGDEPTARREVYEVVLPGGDRGMDRSVTCSVSAGDGKTEPVRVVLIDVPSLLVREVRYEFPEYTKRPPETVEWQGDLRALEGTRATLVAEASLPLAKAWIDFGCDGKHDWEFSVPQHDLATARASFPLRLNETRSGPWFDSYQLQMQLASAEAGDVLTEEVRHRIEVIADLSPEVRIVKPAEQLVRVPPAAPAAVQVAARDPDFAISRVGLEYRVVAGDQQIADGFVWQPDVEHQGPLAATLVFTPADLGAGAGHRIAYRAVVEDNREPKPNRGVSHSDGEPWPEFEVDVKAEPQQLPPPPADTPDPEASQGQQPNEPGSEEPADTEGRQPQQGEDQPGQQDGPQQGENSGEQNAGNQESAAEQPEAGAEGQQAEDGQQGDAGEGQQGTSGEGSQSSPGEGGEDGQAGETSEGQPNEGQQGESQQGEGTAPGDGTGQADGGQSTEDEGAGNSRQRPGAEGDNTQGAGRQGGDRGQGEQNGDGRGEGRGDGNNAESQPNEPIASDGTEDGEAMERILEHRRQGEEQGEGQQGEGQQGEGQQGEGQQGEGQQGEGQQGEGQQGEGQQGEGQQGEGQQGEGQQGEGQQGEGQQGEGQQGEGQQGEGQQGEGQQGEGQQGEGQQGEGQQGEGQQGEGQQGEGQQGEGQQGEGQQGEGQQGEGQQGEGQQGEGQQGEGQQGEGQQGEGQQGEGQQGEGQQGEGQQGQAAGGAGQQESEAGDLGESGDTRGMAGQGSWSSGDGERRGGETPSTPAELEWGSEDLEHARNATDLAIEHLRESLNQGDRELLEQLGWNEAQARAFLARWDAMQRLQRSEDPQDRVEFERAVRSLGLRPEGMRTQRRATREGRSGEAEGIRSRPPSEYLDRVRAYSEGLSTQ